MADRFDAVPDHLASSPFLRAQQTAAPTRSRFRSIEIELWPIHEFTYLSPVRCAGTSVTQRRPWAQAYWDDADPQKVDGAGAESFATFIERVSATKTRLEQLDAAGLRSIALFGHGQFFQALRWLIHYPQRHIDSQAMRIFRELDVVSPIANGSGFACAFDGQTWTS
jgi:broad specificity phosphatase PhoE